MAGEEAKSDMMFEVICFGWGDQVLEEDFEKDGISMHVENVCVTEEVTAISPLQVDVVVFASNSKGMRKPEMAKFINRYDRTLLRIWFQSSCDDYDISLIQKEKFLVVYSPQRCQAVLKQFFSQLCAFLTKLMNKLDLNDSKTVELEDLSVYADQFGIDLMPQDLDFFLAEYQDEGDSFLTPRGVLKWIKKGKPDCKVGTIILKVIEAKNLLKGYSVVLKKVFLGDEIPAAKPHQLQGDVEITVGEKDFISGAGVEAHIWSRDRLPHSHPADILDLTPTDSSFIVSVTFRRNPERSFTQIQDFVRNAVFKLETLITSGGPGEAETMVTVDYKITETEATFYIIPDFSIMASRDSSIRRDFKPLLSPLRVCAGYEAHLTLESKTGLKDMLARAKDHFQDFIGVGVRAALTYSLDSGLRDLLYSFVALPPTSFPYYLVRNLVLKSHFSDLSELPEGLQQVLRKTIPTQISTLSALLVLLGKALNDGFRDYAIEKQIELLLKVTTELFDMTQVKLGLSFFNLVGEATVRLQGLDELLRMDLSELRRKAEEADRAKQAESNSGSEDSSRQRPVEGHSGSSSPRSTSTPAMAVVRMDSGPRRRPSMKRSDSESSKKSLILASPRRSPSPVRLHIEVEGRPIPRRRSIIRRSDSEHSSRSISPQMSPHAVVIHIDSDERPLSIKRSDSESSQRSGSPSQIPPPRHIAVPGKLVSVPHRKRSLSRSSGSVTPPERLVSPARVRKNSSSGSEDSGPRMRVKRRDSFDSQNSFKG